MKPLDLYRCGLLPLCWTILCQVALADLENLAAPSNVCSAGSRTHPITVTSTTTVTSTVKASNTVNSLHTASSLGSSVPKVTTVTTTTVQTVTDTSLSTSYYCVRSTSTSYYCSRPASTATSTVLSSSSGRKSASSKTPSSVRRGSSSEHHTKQKTHYAELELSGSTSTIWVTTTRTVLASSIRTVASSSQPSPSITTITATSTRTVYPSHTQSNLCDSGADPGDLGLIDLGPNSGAAVLSSPPDANTIQDTLTYVPYAEALDPNAPLDYVQLRIINGTVYLSQSGVGQPSPDTVLYVQDFFAGGTAYFGSYEYIAEKYYYVVPCRVGPLLQLDFQIPNGPLICYNYNGDEFVGYLTADNLFAFSSSPLPTGVRAAELDVLAPGLVAFPSNIPTRRELSARDLVTVNVCANSGCDDKPLDLFAYGPNGLEAMPSFIAPYKASGNDTPLVVLSNNQDGAILSFHEGTIYLNGTEQNETVAPDTVLYVRDKINGGIIYFGAADYVAEHGYFVLQCFLESCPTYQDFKDVGYSWVACVNAEGTEFTQYTSEDGGYGAMALGNPPDNNYFQMVVTQTGFFGRTRSRARTPSRTVNAASSAVSSSPYDNINFDLFAKGSNGVFSTPGLAVPYEASNNRATITIVPSTPDGAIVYFHQGSVYLNGTQRDEMVPPNKVLYVRDGIHGGLLYFGSADYVARNKYFALPCSIEYPFGEGTYSFMQCSNANGTTFTQYTQPGDLAAVILGDAPSGGESNYLQLIISNAGRY